jgi:hypothetical protein
MVINASRWHSRPRQVVVEAAPQNHARMRARALVDSITLSRLGACQHLTARICRLINNTGADEVLAIKSRPQKTNAANLLESRNETPPTTFNWGRLIYSLYKICHFFIQATHLCEASVARCR